MKNTLLILFTLWSINCCGQCIDCSSFEEALKEPKSVNKLTINPWIQGITLDSIPSSIGKFVNARIIYLSGHNITFIPKEIGQLKKLKELSFAECQLTSIPEEIFELKNLRELILVNNQFSLDYIIKIKERFEKEMPKTKLMISRDED